MKLFIDSDGTAAGTDVLVIGDDDMPVGELEGLVGIKFEAVTDGQAQVTLVVLDVPGRYLADKILIHELQPARKRWRETFFGRLVRRG